MKINSTDVNFGGKLILKHPGLWTNGMKNVIKNNESIQKQLQNYDIVGNISKKIEKRTPSYGSIHTKGDAVYKINFVVKNEDLTFIEKIKDFFGLTGKKYDVNRHFHSEPTTISRLKNLNIEDL